ncbi:MAG: hypothetical protein G01um101417_553 [Parcubacteria group bacterium Gr01-1014_17]|nr:MAG: hypothetical protein G01um101417_553 [Parcubacteria group bacterium Gr01-1014_17]
MLAVKASAKPSKIEGIGLFADEKIPKGTVTWRFHPRIDVVPSPGEPETLGVANRDIEKNEEMLVNYRMFDSHDENSKKEYLNN